MIKVLLLFALFLNTAFADPNILGFKKVPLEEALNPISYQAEGGIEESSSTPADSNAWKSFYLAFAVEARYLADCSATSKSALCDFFRSSLSLSGNFTWKQKGDSDRYQVILVPIEFISGRFGKEGLDLRNSTNSFYFTVGFSQEYLRDLGLQIEHKINFLIHSSLNYSNEMAALDEETHLRWIGSAKIFLGSSMTDIQKDSLLVGPTIGGEVKTGLALDLAFGTISLIYTGKIQGEGSAVGDYKYSSVLTSQGIELRYLHSICVNSLEEPSEKDCKKPRKISLGGGLRYEYFTYNFDLPLDQKKIDQSFHRLIFFLELSRF